jgi:energy-coupling factor transporter ATP-binding protein EcfA2
MDEYLMGRLLGKRGGLILHAASTLERDRAILLLGHSGAGKSTLAELAQAMGAEVLSDDRTIVRANGQATAWGTPWHGSYKAGSPRRAPLGAVFLLVQSTENRVVQLPLARAFQEVYVRVIQPTVDLKEIRASVDAVLRLVEQVPVAELHFRPVPSSYELARAAAETMMRPAVVKPEVVASKLLDGVRE